MKIPKGYALPTTKEIHTFVRGMWHGFLKTKPSLPDDETHYYKFAYIVGYVIKVVLIISMAKQGVEAW